MAIYARILKYLNFVGYGIANRYHSLIDRKEISKYQHDGPSINHQTVDQRQKTLQNKIAIKKHVYHHFSVEITDVTIAQIIIVYIIVYNDWYARKRKNRRLKRETSFLKYYNLQYLNGLFQRNKFSSNIEYNV